MYEQRLTSVGTSHCAECNKYGRWPSI